MHTAREIEKATDGYVNSAVLRQWIMKGYIQAGPRAKLPGGPRTFVMREVVKAVLIAELRRCGISMEVASDSAEQIARTRFFITEPAGQGSPMAQMQGMMGSGGGATTGGGSAETRQIAIALMIGSPQFQKR